jgi:hypothetical protein
MSIAAATRNAFFNKQERFSLLLGPTYVTTTARYRGQVIQEKITANSSVQISQEFRQASNRMFQRIVASLSMWPTDLDTSLMTRSMDVKRRLAAATAAEDWSSVAKLAEELAQLSGSNNGQDGPKHAG